MTNTTAAHRRLETVLRDVADADGRVTLTDRELGNLAGCSTKGRPRSVQLWLLKLEAAGVIVRNFAADGSRVITLTNP